MSNLGINPNRPSPFDQVMAERNGRAQPAVAQNGAADNGGHARIGVIGRPVGVPTTLAPVSYGSLYAPQHRHVDYQNMNGGMTRTGNPYVDSPDSLLANALRNNLPELEKYRNKNDKLTQSSLQKIANEPLSGNERQDRNRMLAKAILNRPRLNDAIFGKGGVITNNSLINAADKLIGNSDPNTYSEDPYQAMSNAQVVQAFRGMFDQLRDKSEDRTFFFEKHRYVKKDTIVEMSKDPDAIDKQGNVVRDPSTGLPKKKYGEREVYMAKNLAERPGLLASLDSEKANGVRWLGSHNDDGFLKNYSLDRWLKNDKKEKAS